MMFVFAAFREGPEGDGPVSFCVRAGALGCREAAAAAVGA
jgi:hypothetical protein